MWTKVLLLMIPKKEKEGCHCLAVKKLSTLLRGITRKYHKDCYCLNCLHSFRKEDLMKKIVKTKVFMEL